MYRKAALSLRKYIYIYICRESGRNGGRTETKAWSERWSRRTEVRCMALSTERKQGRETEVKKEKERKSMKTKGYSARL